MDCLKTLGNLDSTSFCTAQAKGAGKRSLQRRREEKSGATRKGSGFEPLLSVHWKIDVQGSNSG